jgi:hypothetical protein
MRRFTAFEDAALTGRLERLDRAESDLQQRIAKRVSQLEAEGRWIRSDPMFQQLSATLKRVRDDMRETEQELLRRGLGAAEKQAA